MKLTIAKRNVLEQLTTTPVPVTTLAKKIQRDPSSVRVSLAQLESMSLAERVDISKKRKSGQRLDTQRSPRVGWRLKK
jgi:predicted transcriptional regulator